MNISHIQIFSILWTFALYLLIVVTFLHKPVQLFTFEKTYCTYIYVFFYLIFVLLPFLFVVHQNTKTNSCMQKPTSDSVWNPTNQTDEWVIFLLIFYIFPFLSTDLNVSWELSVCHVLSMSCLLIWSDVFWYKALFANLYSFPEDDNFDTITDNLRKI